MTLIRRAILALALMTGFGPAIAQAPGPVPALPDAERRTSYSITASTCACAVNFALYGDSTDYANWIEVWVNGVLMPQSGNWTITSPSGPLATLPRPITNAVLTFTTPQTGTVQIVGARRPRRTSQFSESRGVPARDLNVAFSDIIAQNRELWDKTNDFTGRGLFSQPGVTLGGGLPLPSTCANGSLGFDATGLIPVCRSVTTSGFVTLPVVIGHLPVFNSTAGLISDSGISPVGTSVKNPGTGTLEMLMPVQAVTGASKTYATADLFQKTRRSNSGSAMTDALPAAGTVGLVNGTRISIVNAEGTANLTLNAGAGTTIADASSFVIGPNRDVLWVYDLPNTRWWADANTSQALIGTSSTTVGTIPYFSNTTGNALSGTPVFQSGNPGSAALYSAVANPAIGYTTLFNGLQFSLGAPIPSAQQFGTNLNAVMQAIVGTVSIPAGDTTTVQTAGVAGYAITNGPDDGFGPGAVGLFGQGLTTVAHADTFGGNLIAVNTNGDQNSIGFDMNYMAALELDVLVWKKAGGADAAVVGGHAYGLTIAGASNMVAVIPNSSAIVIDRLNFPTNIPWDFGLSTYAGAANYAVVAGPANIGINQGSQPIAFQYSDGLGAPTIGAKIKSDSAGNLQLMAGPGALASLADSSGNALIFASSTFGASKVRILACAAAAGVLTNDATTGQVNCGVTTLPSGLTIPSPTVTGTLTSAAISNSGNISSATFNNITFVVPASTATVTFGSGKTIAISNSMTQTATDGSTIAFGAGGTVLYSGGAAGGDLTGTYPSPTLATIISGAGPIGSATVAPIITYDSKGRLTAVSSATVTPAIGSVTGLGTGIGAALAINAGSAGAPVLFNGALGTPSSGVGTNITNVNAATLGGTTFAAPGAIGSGTPGTGAFTTLSASSTVSGSGFSTYLASPPAIGGTAAAAGTFTTLTANTSISSPIHTAPGAHTFQSNGSTFAGSISTSQQWAFGANVAPDTTVTINNNTVAAVAPSLATQLHTVGTDGAIAGLYSDAYGSGQVVWGGRLAGNTAASKAAVGATITTMSIAAYAWDGSAYGINSTIDFLTLNAQTGSDHSGYIKFATTPTGSTSRVAAAWVTSSGSISIGSSKVESGVGTLNLKAQTFASLTACSAAIEGTLAAVTDSSTATWGATVTGSGSNHVLAYCDNAAWTVAGK